jgi:hypothetical protein
MLHASGVSLSDFQGYLNYDSRFPGRFHSFSTCLRRDITDARGTYLAFVLWPKARTLGSVKRRKLPVITFAEFRPQIEPTPVNVWRHFFKALSQYSEKRLLASSCLSVYPHGTAPTERIFMKICISRRSVEKIQASSKSDKKNQYCTWRPMYIYDNMSLNST